MEWKVVAFLFVYTVTSETVDDMKCSAHDIEDTTDRTHLDQVSVVQQFM